MEPRKDYGASSDECASIDADIACKPGAWADVHAVAQYAIVIYGRRSIDDDRSAQLRAGADGSMRQDLASLAERYSVGNKRCTMDDRWGLQFPPLEQIGQGQTITASCPADGYGKKQPGVQMLPQPCLQTDVAAQHRNSCNRRWQVALVDEGDNLDPGALQSLVEYLGLSCCTPENNLGRA